MKTVVCRTLVAASLALALPCAAQVSVVGCISDASNRQHITDDPNRCPPERKLDIVSIKTSWTQTASATAGGGAGAGKVLPGPFVISKNLDRSSPGLFLDVVTGRRLDVLVVVFDTGPRGNLRRVFSFLLEEALVSSLEFDAADSRARGAMPLDLVGFSYVKLTVRDDLFNVTEAFDFAGNRVQ